jgi:hypothetical protein
MPPDKPTGLYLITKRGPRLPIFYRGPAIGSSWTYDRRKAARFGKKPGQRVMRLLKKGLGPGEHLAMTPVAG